MMAEANKIPVAIYTRKSIEVAEHMKIKDNWELISVFADIGISGSSVEKRPGLTKMLRDCREGKIKIIIVKDIAQLSRNTVDALRCLKSLNELGVSVYVESEEKELTITYIDEENFVPILR